jgi:putative heme-binding domain-containing protein
VNSRWTTWLLVCFWVGSWGIVNVQPAGGGGDATDQSLTSELIEEGATVLARAARKDGSAIRGAILFPQKKLNCANCHRSGSLALGPNLMETGQDVPDEYFVESILLPSKVIKEGFESVKVLTTGGDVIVGRIAVENESQLVLRDPVDAKKLIRLEREDVEQVVPNKVSTMPAGLADQLEDRQQFLDLVRYLMEIAGTSKAAGESAQFTIGGQVDQRIRGLALIDHHGCLHCHHERQQRFLANGFPKKAAPELRNVSSRINADYMLRFIANPHRVKPGTSMPDLLGKLSDEDRRQTAEAIVHYLSSLGKKQPPPLESADADVDRGDQLFHSVGCVACHSPRENGTETLGDDSVPLGDLTEKYALSGLTAFLEDPHAARPSGRMPNMKLRHREASDIAAFLLGGADDPLNSVSPEPALVSAGRQHFQEIGCNQCHRIGDQKPRTAFTAFGDLNPKKGCLSGESGDWPQFRLAEAERAAIQTAIAQHGELTDAEQITLSMQTHRCYSCHQRDELGGVSPQRDTYFQTSDPNLGPQGRIPPTLTGVGAKLKPKWLRQVLVSGRAIRPYVKTRMPQYGAANVEHLIDLFGRVDQRPEIDFGHWQDTKEAKKVGTELVGRGGLNCIACHTYRLKPSQTMSAVDLTEMGERLQKNWFYHYMQSPQQLNPQTVMPSFWPGGKPIRKDIAGGDMIAQIEAIWIYLQDGRQARTPPGVIQKPIKLLASDRAVMLRRRYPNIGKRGIGVGYPGGVNLAFDAEQMRLATLWKGEFADPGAVWRGQGSGMVRPLSREVIQLPPGPELDDGQSPWVVDDGRPPDHQFTGYFLDELDRPTFTYRFEQIDVKDYPVDVARETGEPMLKRTLTFTAERPRENLVFRVAADDNISRDGNGWFRVGEKLKVQMPDGLGEIVVGNEGKQLVLPIDLPAGSSRFVILYAW